jgi:hypothetical protein
LSRLWMRVTATPSTQRLFIGMRGTQQGTRAFSCTHIQVGTNRVACNLSTPSSAYGTPAKSVITPSRVLSLVILSTTHDRGAVMTANGTEAVDHGVQRSYIRRGRVDGLPSQVGGTFSNPTSLVSGGSFIPNVLYRLWTNLGGVSR